MTSVDRLNTLRGLVKEIDGLIEKASTEQYEFERKLEEKREEAWLMFCTEIAPYWELVKELKPRFTEKRIYAKTGIDDSELAFTRERVMLFYNNRRCISAYLTEDNDFCELDDVIRKDRDGYPKIKDLPKEHVLIRLPKEFDFKLFEESFIHAVEEEMRMRSELSNTNYEQAKAKYEAEI